MDQKFYRCNHCGNLLIPILDSGVNPVCCGEAMQVLKPDEVDAAVEKHIPVINRCDDGKHIEINIGSAPHPMVEEHFIEFVVLMFENRIGTIKLSPGMEPKAVCAVDDNSIPITVYAYCNLHGLWKATA